LRAISGVAVAAEKTRIMEVKTKALADFPMVRRIRIRRPNGIRSGMRVRFLNRLE